MKRADADIYYFSCAGMHLGVAAMFTSSYTRKVVFRVASDMDCDPELHVLRYWRHKVMYRYGLRRADAVLAQTAKQQAMLASMGRSSQIVPPLSDLSRHGLDRAARDISVLWVNNLRDSKRADLLLELARRMPGVQFDMVGGPVKGFESVYEEASRTAQGLQNVRFHGFVPYEKTAELYERTRLLVSTSQIEGFPNTYLQAWASGAPVVAFFDPDGVIERNGLGHAVRTLDEMQEAIKKLLTDDADWEATGARCRAHVASYGDENSMLAPYIETFLALQADGEGRPLNTRPRPAASRE
jgi:glycosyltransferase involved in cell wall biosynthesis